MLTYNVYSLEAASQFSNVLVRMRQYISFLICILHVIRLGTHRPEIDLETVMHTSWRIEDEGLNIPGMIGLVEAII